MLLNIKQSTKVNIKTQKNKTSIGEWRCVWSIKWREKPAELLLLSSRPLFATPSLVYV